MTPKLLSCVCARNATRGCARVRVRVCGWACATLYCRQREQSKLLATVNQNQIKIFPKPPSFLNQICKKQRAQGYENSKTLQESSTGAHTAVSAPEESSKNR